MNRSKLDQLDAKHQELTSVLLHEIGRGTAADLARMKTATEEIGETGKAIFREIARQDDEPDEPITDPIHSCHEMAMQTLEMLGSVIGQFEPESVQ